MARAARLAVELAKVLRALDPDAVDRAAEIQLPRCFSGFDGPDLERDSFARWQVLEWLDQIAGAACPDAHTPPAALASQKTASAAALSRALYQLFAGQAEHWGICMSKAECDELAAVFA